MCKCLCLHRSICITHILVPKKPKESTRFFESERGNEHPGIGAGNQTPVFHNSRKCS